MRWKAKIDDAGGCIALHRLVGTFTRLARPGRNMSKIHLTPDTVSLIHKVDGVDTGAQAWTEIVQKNVFCSYRIESQHPNNEILFQIHMDQFARALKSTVTASEVTLKLAKRGDVVILAVVIGMTTVSGMVRPVTQEVPVFVMKADDIADTRPPVLPTPEVNLYLPALRVLRSVIDRMKALSDNVTVSVNLAGDLVLKIETDIVSVKTFFRGLEKAQWKDGAAPPPSGAIDRLGPTDFLDAVVPVKTVHQFISAHQQDPGPVLLSTARDRALVLFCLQPDANITFYIPTTVDDD